MLNALSVSKVFLTLKHFKFSNININILKNILNNIYYVNLNYHTLGTILFI